MTFLMCECCDLYGLTYISVSAYIRMNIQMYVLLYHIMYICAYVYMYNAVENPNTGHFGTVFVLGKEVVLFGRSKMYWDYKEKISWDLQLCPL